MGTFLHQSAAHEKLALTGELPATSGLCARPEEAVLFHHPHSVVHGSLHPCPTERPGGWQLGTPAHVQPMPEFLSAQKKTDHSWEGEGSCPSAPIHPQRRYIMRALHKQKELVLHCF